MSEFLSPEWRKKEKELFEDLEKRGEQFYKKYEEKETFV